MEVITAVSRASALKESKSQEVGGKIAEVNIVP
jgi:hypothetical protein